jgi:hypothetical protein
MKSAHFPLTKQPDFTRTRIGQEKQLRQDSALAETEIFQELPVILVDRGSHVIGPMIITFDQVAVKIFQSLPADRLRQFNGSRN